MRQQRLDASKRQGQGKQMKQQDQPEPAFSDQFSISELDITKHIHHHIHYHTLDGKLGNGSNVV